MNLRQLFVDACDSSRQRVIQKPHAHLLPAGVLSSLNIVLGLLHAAFGPPADDPGERGAFQCSAPVHPERIIEVEAER